MSRETAVGVETEMRKADAAAQLEAETQRLATLEGRWNCERELVEKVLDLRAKLRGETGKVEGTQSKLEKAADGRRQDRKAGRSHRDRRSPQPSERACWPSSSGCRPSSTNCKARPR